MIRHERAARRPTGSVVAAGATLIVIYFALRALSGVMPSLLLMFFGVLLAITMDVPTTALAKRMPRPVALLWVLLALVSLIVGSVVLVAPRVAAQAALLVQ